MKLTNKLCNPFTKLSGLVSSGLINFTRFVNHITCSIDKPSIFNDKSFRNFCLAYHNLYGWRTDTGHGASCLVKCLFAFIAFNRMHCTELFSYFQKSQQDYRFPEFVHTIFETIVKHVKSFTENNAHVVGSILFKGRSTRDILTTLKQRAESKDVAYFLNIFGETPLRSIFIHSRIQQSFFELLIFECNRFLEPYNTLGAKMDSVDRNNLDLLFVEYAFSTLDIVTSEKGKALLNMSVQKYDQGSSQHLSIYRFSQVDSSNAGYDYMVSIKSLENLSEGMFKLFISFIFIFNPTFSVCSMVIGDYQPFNFSGVNSSKHWELYLGCSRLRPSKIVTKNKKSKPVSHVKSDSTTISESENNIIIDNIDIAFINDHTLLGKIHSVASLLPDLPKFKDGPPLIFIFT